MAIDFTKKYKKSIAKQFVDAWDEGGPVLAGRLMREILPDSTLDDDDQLAEFRPYIQSEFESRGYTFDEEVTDYEEETTN